MGVENVLDLAGIDILAAAYDHVLAPALNTAIPVLVETPQIAGVKPAFGIDCRSRRFRIVEIVFHDGVSASADFAYLSDRHNRAGFRTDDLDFGLRHGPAVEIQSGRGSSGSVCVTYGDTSVSDRNINALISTPPHHIWKNLRPPPPD